MKYTICGYQQTVLLEYHLDAVDAAILNYVDDFYNTGKMYHKIINNQVYFWINFGTIIDDMPILGIVETRGISRRFDKYLDCGLMKKHVVKGKDSYLYDGQECERAGTFTYFTFEPEKKLSLVGDHKEKQESDPYKRRYALKGRPSEGTPLKGSTSKDAPADPLKADRPTPERLTKDTPIIDAPTIDISLIVGEAEKNHDYLNAFNDFVVESSEDYRKDTAYWIHYNAALHDATLSDIIYALEKSVEQGKAGKLSYYTGIIKKRTGARGQGIKAHGIDPEIAFKEYVTRRLSGHIGIIKSFQFAGDVIRYSLADRDDHTAVQELMDKVIAPDVYKETGRDVIFQIM